ncbi:MAG: helix-turn-helix domain-containing protein [Atopobiaceae bacterium]|nr:helix-turn-helix domain-containing protein [Atopobiaceae bacterium]
MKNTGNRGNMSADLFMRVGEAAEILGVSQQTVTRMCRDGEFAAVKLRSTWRINREAFMRQVGLA